MSFIFKIILRLCFIVLLSVSELNLFPQFLWAFEQLPSPFSLPPYGEDYSTKDETGLIDANHITIQGIILGKNTFQDVFNRFGKANIFNLWPNDDHSPAAVCYLSTNKADKTFIWFESGYLFGWEIIYSFIIGNREILSKFEDNCSKSSLVNNKLATKSDIYYGMKKVDFSKIFNKTLNHKENYFYYRYLKKEKVSKEILRKNKELGLIDDGWNYFYFDSGIYVLFSDEKVNWFKAYKSESN